MYGLIGCSLSIVTIDKDRIEKFFYSLYWLIVAVQVLGDIAAFVWFYDDNIGYYAHFSGFIIGWSMGLGSYLWKKCIWKKAVAIIGIFITICLLFYLIYHYCTVFPSKDSYDPDQSCCSLMYSKGAQLGLDIVDTMKLYYCFQSRLYPR